MFEYPFSLLVGDYEPITHDGDHEMKLRKNCDDYNQLLTEIETLSLKLKELLSAAKEHITPSLLQQYTDETKSLEKWSDELVYTMNGMDFADYCREMMKDIMGQMEETEKFIESEIPLDLLTETRKIHSDINYLLNDKYNMYDKYYLDD